MPKVILNLLLILIVSVINLSYPQFASAASLGNCDTIGVTLTKSEFTKGVTSIPLNFNIQKTRFENQFLNAVPPKWIKAEFGSGGFAVDDGTPQQINSRDFTLTLTHSQLLGTGKEGIYTPEKSHVGKLRISDDGGRNYNDFCTNVSYLIKQPVCDARPSATKMPQGSSVFINFHGTPNKTYTPTVWKDRFQGGQGAVVFGPQATDADGQGHFNVVLARSSEPAQEGDKFLIRLVNTADSFDYCDIKDLLIDNNASPPPIITTPVTPNNGGSSNTNLGCSQNCSKAAGEPCIGKDGIQTAIGCIPTDPEELIKSLLKFSAGIAGGVAFLLMVIGAFQMVASSGNPDALKAGQERFKDAIIGLLFVLLSVLILQIIGIDILQISGFKRIP